MYFITGWPKLLRTGEPLLDLQHNPPRSLFATLSSSTLHVWSAEQENILLAYCTLPLSVKAKYGTNKSLLWSLDSSFIAVIQSGGDICLYSVEHGRYDVRLQSESNIHSLQTSCQLKIELKALFLTPRGGAVCMATNDKNVFYVATKQGYLLSMRWSGEIVEEIPFSSVSFLSPSSPPSSSSSSSLSLPSLASSLSSPSLSNSAPLLSELPPSFSTSAPSLSPPSSSSPPMVVVQMVFNRDIGLFGVVFENGNTALLSVDKGDGKKKLIYGYWVVYNTQDVANELMRKDKAVCMQLNGRHRLAAIGYENGEVCFYDISNLNGPKQLRTLSLNASNVSPNQTGAVSAMMWAPDFKAIAVGWQRRSVALWSIHGSRLFCPVTASSALNGSRPSEVDPLHHGVVSTSWGPEGYRLLVVPALSHSEVKKQKDSDSISLMHQQHGKEESNVQGPLGGSIILFNLIKGCLNSPAMLGGEEQVILWGDDQILLLCPTETVESMKWQRVQLPRAYVADNWPVLHVAGNKSTGDIAIAGRRGVALYSPITNRWRLFGDRNEEQEIECKGLCWYKTTIIIANYNQKSKLYEVLFYPRHHLANTDLIHRMPMPKNRSPHLIDCNDRYLLLFTTDGFLYQYLISANQADPVTQKPTLQLTLIHQIAMPSLTISTYPTSLSLLPPHAPNASSSPYSGAAGSLKALPEHSQWVLINCNGALILSDLSLGLQVEIASEVEHYWWVKSRHLLPHLGDTLWTYGPAGLQFSFPFSEEGVYPLIKPWLTPQHPNGECSEPMKEKHVYIQETVLEWDEEVYCVGVIGKRGIVVALSPVLLPSPSHTRCLDIETKIQPFLHSIMAHVLQSHVPPGIPANLNKSSKDGDSEDEKERHTSEQPETRYSILYKLAAYYRHMPHFTHSLELLLHNTLQQEEDNSKFSSEKIKKERENGTAPQSQVISDKQTRDKELQEQGRMQKETLLHKVMVFLRGLDEFREIVVACARKTDPASWQLLFSNAGNPIDLFQECIKRGELEAAGWVLAVVEYVDGACPAALAALTLLEAALECDRLDLVRQVVRFLHLLFTCEEEEEIEKLQKAVSTNIKGSTSYVINSGQEEKRAMDLLLSRYARKLLESYKLADLLYFAKCVYQPLNPWLQKERKRAAVIHDFSVALHSVHVQFCLPYPTIYSSTTELGAHHENGTSSEEGEAEEMYAQAMHDSMRTTISDLESLLREMLGAECCEWSLVLSTVLLKADTVLHLLSTHHHLCCDFDAMLETHPSKGYKDFYQAVKGRHSAMCAQLT